MDPKAQFQQRYKEYSQNLIKKKISAKPLQYKNHPSHKKIYLGIIAFATFLMLPVGVFMYQSNSSSKQTISESPVIEVDQDKSLLCVSPETLQVSASCAQNYYVCSWEKFESPTQYTYKIVEVEKGIVVQTEKTSSLSADLKPERGKTYRCEVSVLNKCGMSINGISQATCTSITQ